MSGIEVVGFILGAFPLLISALEHYREGAEALEDWWQIKREYKKCRHDVQFHKLSFEGHLERFLLPLVVGDDEIESLIADPGGKGWKNPDMEKRLKEQLPKSYDLFVETIEEINHLMEELKQELGVKKVHFHSRVSGEEIQSAGIKLKRSHNKVMTKASLEYQAQRVKFGFGRAARDKLFDEFSKYNARLRDLLDTHDRTSALKQAREGKKKSMVGKMLWRFWRHARSLHSILTKAWLCDCKSLHHANLLLQHRITPDVEFKILFSYAQDTPGSSASLRPWDWQETDIKMLEVSSETQALSLPVATLREVPPFQVAGQVAVTSIMARKRTSGVVKTPFGIADSSSPPSKPKLAWKDTNLTSKAPLAIQSASTTGNTDLCTTIATCIPDTPCLGVLKDEEYHYSLCPLAKQHSVLQTPNIITLEALLKKDSQINLTRRQRYFLALTIASSHFQLHSSPWLRLQWSKRDIVFLHDPTSPTSISIEQPYISHKFCALPTSLIPNLYGDRSISNLGIMLIELCFGIALEDHETRKRYPTGDDLTNPFLDVAAALEWAGSVNDEAGPEYADAVAWCLQRSVTDTQDDKWREELFAKVVEPLQYCYDQLNVSRR